ENRGRRPRSDGDDQQGQPRRLCIVLARPPRGRTGGARAHPSRRQDRRLPGAAMSLFLLAARNVARNRRRSLLTGGVVVFGFAAIALAGGFMSQSFEGLRDGTIRNG